MPPKPPKGGSGGFGGSCARYIPANFESLTLVRAFNLAVNEHSVPTQVLATSHAQEFESIPEEPCHPGAQGPDA
jgi:hypothetical protein